MLTVKIIALLAAQVSAPSPTTSPQPAAEEPRVLPQGVVEIHVEELHCKTCAKKLARKLYSTPGVKRVKTYVSKNLAVVELQPKKTVDLAKLWRAVELAEQKPLALLVLDKKLVAKDFPQPAAETAQAVGDRGAVR